MKLTKNCRCTLAVILMIAVIVSWLPRKIAALSSDEIQNQIAELEDERDVLQSELDELDSKIQSTVTEIEDIAAQKSILDQQIFVLYQQMQTINEQISAYSVLIADKQEELNEAQKNYDSLRAKSKDRIRAMEEGGTLSYWSVIFKSNSFSDLLDRLNIIEEIANADNQRLKELNQAAQQLQNVQEALRREKDNLQQKRTELTDTEKLLADKRKKADALLASLNLKGQEYLDQLDAAMKDFGELNQQIAEKEAEYDRAVDAEYWATYVEPTFPEGTDSAGNDSGAYWAPPLDYISVASPYGYRIHPIYGDWRLHAGVDLGQAWGAPIYASRGGVVTTASYEEGGAGNYIIINHGDGYASGYMHMTYYIVDVGEYITQGQVIGYVGDTGAATAPHLHFSIYHNGTTVNPMDYL